MSFTNLNVSKGNILVTTALGLIVSLMPAPWPAVSDRQEIRASGIASTATVRSPTLSSSNVALAPPSIPASSAVRSAAIAAGSSTIQTATLSATSSVPIPRIEVANAGVPVLYPNAIASTSGVTTGTVSAGSSAVSASAIPSGATANQPSTTAGTSNIAAPATQSSASTAAPSVSAGTSTMQPSAIAATSAVISPSVAMSVPAGPAWTQERPVTIANNSNSATTGYQSLVTLSDSNFDFASARSDGGDLRFTDSDKTTALPFWVESFDKTAKSAKVWVKADLPANDAKTIYMYSANDNAVSKSNGDNVFPLFDDFAGLPGWNVYSVTNPVINTASGESIVGDPMVIEPDALTNERGAFYFISASGGLGHVGYFTINGDGSSFTRVGKVLDSSTTSYKRVIKPSVIYWPAANKYYMVATCENDGSPAVLGLFEATSRQGPWTFNKVLLTADPSIYFNDGANGSQQLENTFIDCGFFMLDGSTLRLYYSANTIGNKEPKYFCVATFADGPTSTLTRYANNPIAKPNTATTYANVGLGGMAVRKITTGDMAGKYEFSYNAFTSGEVSHVFIGYSDTAFSLAIRDEDRILPLGGPASWNRVRNYRPCGYNAAEPTAAATQVVFNALGDTETIGYAKKGLKLNLSKWVPRLQGQPRINFENGAMRMGETRTANLSYYFLIESSYVPGDNIILETRAKLEQSFATGNSVFAPLLIASSERPAPDAVANLQAVFVMDRHKQVRHQNRSGGSWGSEDTITTTYPAVGTYLTYQMIKKPTNMDYAVINDSGTDVGRITNNTDAPQGASLPFVMGGQGAEMSFDYVRARQYLASPPPVTVGAASTVSKTNL